MKIAKKIIIYAIPCILLLGFIILKSKVDAKIQKNKVGKSEFLTSNQYGKVQEVYVKAGDSVSPGKEICSYVITDSDLNVPVKEALISEIFVKTEPIKGETFVDYIELPGISYPFQEVDVPVKVNAQVQEFFCKEGQIVKKGGIIAKLEAKDYELLLKQATTSFDMSKIEYDRFKYLLEKDAASKSDWDRIKTDYDYKKSLLDEAYLNLERCSIVSPIDGIVDEIYIDAGEFANLGNPIVKVIDISKMKITIGIPEKDISFVRDLKEIEFSVSSLETQELFKGKVNYIRLSGSKFAKVYPMEILFENEKKDLVPGMVVKAKIVRNTYENAIVLSLFQIIAGDDEYFTFVYENGMAKKKIVELGAFQRKRVHITNGLKIGDEIISRGQRLVVDGMKVVKVNDNI